MNDPTKFATGDEGLIAAEEVGKVFHTYKRRNGLTGIFRNFFHREAIDITALDGIDLRVGRGEMVGLIGVNGAGKTTLVKCLTGIIPVSSGKATLFGRDCFSLGNNEKRRLSLVMGQRSQLWWDLPPIDSFKLLAEIYQVGREKFERRVHSYAKRLNVVESLDLQLRQLSLGQRMKMEIIGAFLHDPEVVFLDEPTIGLDLISQATIRAFLVELNRERNATIILTSHDMEDIEETCHRLVILNEGRIIYSGDLVTLMARLKHRRSIEIHLEPGAEIEEEALRRAAVPFQASLVKRVGPQVTFHLPAEESRHFVKSLFDKLPIRDLTIERQPLSELVREIYQAGRLVT